MNVAHAGGNNHGFTALIYRLPRDKHFVAILTNAGPEYFNEKLHEMSRKIIDILYGKTYELPKHSIAEILAVTLSNDGLSAALRQYRELKTRDSHSITEGGLNRLGYDLLRGNQIEAAIAVFTLGVEEFPESS